MLKITVYPKSGGNYTRTFYSVASAKKFVDGLVAAACEAAQQITASDGAYICANCGHAANPKHCGTCGMDNPPRA